jgi:outer membrane putative beta-barrel porin/alpha-amylase
MATPRRDTGRRASGARGLLCLVGVVALLAGPAPGQAGDLKNTVHSLYPNGITLEPTGHQAHFTAASLQGLDTLNSAIAANLGVFNFSSPVTGFTFDVERGVPVRTTESLGPLLAERAPTIGAGRLNVAMSYTRVEFSRFEGQPLSDLKLTFKHEDFNHDGALGPTPTFPFDFELDDILVRVNMRIKEDVVGLFATYGLTQNWDVGIVVPIVHIDVRATSHAEIVRRSSVSTLVHNFGPNSTPPDSSAGGEATGVGDIILRTKRSFLRNDPVWPDMAVAAELKLPTGDADNLLGTGETNLKGLFVASKTYDWITPHVNLGFEISTEGTREYNLRYVVGADIRALPSLTFALGLLGRWKPDGDGIGDNVVDAALGLKWNPWRTLVLVGGVQIPVNPDDGLRADVIWTIGMEYTF